MNDNQNNVISHVMMQIEPNSVISEEMIANLVNIFALVNPLSDDEKIETISALHSKLAIRMDRGSYVKEKDHVTWYYTAKRNLPTVYWDRYRTYLFKYANLNSDVIDSLDSSTDEMMDLLCDPRSEFHFQRKGLVIGDVQSGKTATYTALINKAADAGYRIIILLTGTIEKLRRQTQGRLDEGFIGLDSTAFNRDKDTVLVGVGNINPSISGWAVTSTSSDFNTSTGSKLSGKLSGINDPVLFVLKKNSSVLSKLEQWLRLYNANPADKKIHLPMLLIDDEADNASVNTKNEDSPTTINANIRKLLKLFVKSNYVGFTATPFANIFIDPESNQEMLDDDLFPKDFIYALEPPTNYVGARSMFSEDGKYTFMLKENDDCEYYLPFNHKKDDVLNKIPGSMKEAIASFFIGNAIRDLRGHNNKHRTMLINVSRFIDVQESISKVVDSFVRECQREVKNYHLIGEEAMQYDTFTFMKHVFDKHFASIPKLEYNWETIQRSLHEAIASIVVRTVNGGNASKNLNYDECEEDGLRLIAIGGYSLSRGLTLEGLLISYFYRNSKMYDTLMQMGRWFGYRDGYSDICQVWMSETAIDWYSYISVASDELRREVRRMQADNRTPMDFGLCVRSDINALLVTARNKMKTATNHTMAVSLNGKVVETPFIHLDKEIVALNYSLTESFISLLKNDGYDIATDDSLELKNNQILNLPKAYIIDYLSAYRSHYLNMDFKVSDLVGIINDNVNGTLDNWDVVIANGNADPAERILGVDIKLVERKFGIREEAKALQLSGKKSRLGSPNLAKGGLTHSIVKEIEDAEKKLFKIGDEKKTFAQELYFRSGIRRNPLLVIYPVKLKPLSKNADNVDKHDDIKAKIVNEYKTPIIGLSIGFPQIHGFESEVYQYKINLIKYRELIEMDHGYEEEDEILN
ncbi:MAG: Z1 domain-containing protein, partial [Bacillota bacterium]|nr:Z1 domain-containing protein [Bacillota bacterium]